MAGAGSEDGLETQGRGHLTGPQEWAGFQQMGEERGGEDARLREQQDCEVGMGHEWLGSGMPGGSTVPVSRKLAPGQMTGLSRYGS